MLYWGLLVGLCAVTFVSIYKQWNWLNVVSKLGAIFIILGFVSEYTYFSTAQSIWVSLALVCIIFSDLWASFYRGSHHIEIIFFSVATLLYSKALWLQVSASLSLWLPVFVIAVGGLLLLVLLPLFDKIVMPTIISGLIHLQLVWAAVKLWQADSELFALYALVGSVLLAIAMILWAIHNYSKPFRSASYWVSGLHYGAHASLAASVFT